MKIFNAEEQKEYQEHYSPDGEYIQYMMENPEMFEKLEDSTPNTKEEKEEVGG